MKNLNKHLVFLLLLSLNLTLSIIGLGQTIIHVDSARGVCYISNITPEQAKKTAIIEAKNDALLRAGVSERVMVYSSLETFSTNDTTIEYFSSLSNIVSKGQVVSWEILKEKKYINEQNNFVYEVVINADVIKYETKPDPNFSAKLTGLKSVYYEGESLEFNSEISQNGYIYVFLVNNLEASQLYPNGYEREQMFDILSSHQFPTDDNIEYKLTLDGKEKEKNTLVFVLTKSKSTPMVNDSHDLYKWLYLIEPNQLFYIFQPINIIRK